MASSKRALPLVALALALGGCGTVQVPVSHLSLRANFDRQRYDTLQQVYLIIHRPPAFDGSWLGQVMESAAKQSGLSQRVYAIDAPAFAAGVEKTWAATGCHVTAYRVITTFQDTDPFLSRIGPTAVLTVEFESMDIRGRATQRFEDTTNKNGKKTRRKIIESSYEGRLLLHCRLVSTPANKTLFDDVATASLSRDFNSAPSEAYEDQMSRDLVEQAGPIVAHLLWPVQAVTSYRPLFKIKEQDDSVAAAKLANQGRWPEAEEVWKRRIAEGKGGWRDRFNLAVAAEKKQEYGSSRVLYKTARTESGTDEEAGKISWEKIDADIADAVVSTASVSGASNAWFGRRVAVLPFSDETVSIDGPDLIHQLVFQTIKGGGYNVISVDEVTQVLRDHGFSEGGQLTAVQPEKIAEWLKADWLIFGHIEDFNEVNIGIYDRRTIAGKLTFWDGATNNEFWSTDKKVKTERVATKGGILGNFLVNVAMGMIERLAKNPMGNEIHQYVAKNLEAFPLKPAPRR